VRDARSGVSREIEPAALASALDDRFEARLIDWDLAAIQALDLVGIHIDTQNVVAGVRQTCAGHQTDVASPEDSHSHSQFPRLVTALGYYNAG
jgi:hypothetical protein